MYKWIYIKFIYIIFWIIFIIKNLSRFLNIRHIRDELPKEYHDIYNQKEYSKSQLYLKETTIFSIITSFFSTTFSKTFPIVSLVILS